MNGLTEFLLARIAEEEAAARECGGNEGGWLGYGHQHVLATDEGVAVDPPRLLAECEAKRYIIGYRQQYDEPETAMDKVLFPSLCVPLDRVIRILAAIYADHPDYRSEWKP